MFSYLQIEPLALETAWDHKVSGCFNDPTRG